MIESNFCIKCRRPYALEDAFLCDSCAKDIICKYGTLSRWSYGKLLSVEEILCRKLEVNFIFEAITTA